MMNFEEYFINEKYNNEELDRQARVNLARRYSARCYRKRDRRNYIIAVVVGLILAALFFTWQITRPEEPLVESADTSYMDLVSEPVVSAELKLLDKFSLTAYCPCEICCGQWALNRPNGIVYTASGVEAVAGVTVAVDPDVIPLGTRICIEGLGVYEAQDTGNFSGNVIDIYFEDHETACEFGLKHGKVWEVLM